MQSKTAELTEAVARRYDVPEYEAAMIILGCRPVPGSLDEATENLRTALRGLVDALGALAPLTRTPDP